MKILILLIVLLFVTVISVTISKCFLLIKMNETPWQAIIPIIGSYTFYRRLWDTSLYFFAVITNSIFLTIGIGLLYAINVGNELNKRPGMSEKFSIFAVQGSHSMIALFATFGILSIIIVLIKNWKLVHSFGKGFVYFIGITFLPFVFYPLLAFSKSEYQDLRILTIQTKGEKIKKYERSTFSQKKRT